MTDSKKYTRNPFERIFVNRNLNLDKITHIGFDMDYTLAVYLEEFEHLQYGLVITKLIEKGYPEGLKKLKYDPKFGVRGIYIDKQLGNFLKIDQFGYILTALHGRKHIKDFSKIYAEKFIYPEDIGKRYHCIDTLFGFPEICLYADVITFLEESGTFNESVSLSYKSVFEDIRDSSDGMHHDGTLKKAVIADTSKYIRKDEKLALLFHLLREGKKKIFLLTNSEYFYTNAVMGYMLNDVREDYKSWKDYFDIIISFGCKPRFFESGTTLREVDETTGQLKFTKIDSFQKGKVYQGGNLELFKKFTGTSGSEVLYVGDNINHDIIKSKDSRVYWRTCLIVKELDLEINSWQHSKDEYQEMVDHEYERAKTYQNKDLKSKDKSDGEEKLKSKIKQSINNLDAKFNPYFGSLFRSGPSESYFSTQVQKYADLYTSDHLHFLNYPSFYYFSPLQKFYPHEHLE